MLYGLGALVWLSVLSRVQVSLAYPFVSISFLITTALAVAFMGEPLTRPMVIGTLLIGTMLNGMTIMDVSYSGQNLIKGVVLLAAVIADSFLNPRNEETAQQGDI